MNPTSAEKRNVLLLASTQALFQTASVMVMMLSGLAGLQLASDKSLATLPIAMMMVAAAAIMIPASMLPWSVSCWRRSISRYGRVPFSSRKISGWHWSPLSH